jgi:hypothetical protein
MVKANDKRFQELLLEQMYEPLPDDPKRKSSYWESWPNLEWEKGKHIKSKIEPDILLELGKRTYYPFPCLMRKIIDDIRRGASLGNNDKDKAKRD